MGINFNRPTVLGTEEAYLKKVLEKQKLSGDAEFTQKCHEWFEIQMNCPKSLLTTSCSTALDMSAILSEIEPGDEVIMSSFTFVTTANSFVLRGAKVVFVDIRPDTMNLNEELIEEAITEKTKVIVPMHYAGVACEMDTIQTIAQKHGLMIVEDAAQAVMSKYKGKYLGTIGDLATYSFHETKNYTCGEGGLLMINNEQLIERAEIVREKGTDRSKFFRGEIDKYSWVDIGSSYLPSELNAAYLYAQLQKAEEILNDRLKTWDLYHEGLKALEAKGKIELPHIPKECQHNGHLFYIKVEDIDERSEIIEFLKLRDIHSVFHYVPLHSSKAGKKYSRFVGRDKYTTKDSNRLIRLPLYYKMREEDVEYVIDNIAQFFE
ncbi:dTDP-4-amino-4,6-dideoxygalactose transaminase [Candidatus Dojkabacteria bacterium]|nr:dTDP-4-amino-4,6-dideoxygalactose transaminase [Candidatus Dojkabacteria bacterium]